MSAIVESGGKLDLVVTLPDETASHKSGRVFLDDFCQKNRISLVKSGHVNDAEVFDAIERADLDWLFIIGWSQIAGPNLLNAPRFGALGAHPTLLPEGRGRASIPWAILKGLDRTGVTLFKLDGGVDTGPILDQVEIPLEANCTATQLYHDVELAHAELMRKIIPLLRDGQVSFREQDQRFASFWPGRKPEDGILDLTGSVKDAERLIRAVTRPYPGAYYFEGNMKYTIWSAKILTESRDARSSLRRLDFHDGTLLLEDYTVSAI